MLRSSACWLLSALGLARQRRTFVRQSTRTDCGVACALTLLKMRGCAIEPASAVDTLDPDRTGTSLDALRQYMTGQGFAARSLAVPAADIRRMRGPAILHMRQLHYVVLLRVSHRGVLVFDPAMGPVYYPAADFAALYSGHMLEVGDRDQSHVPAIRPTRSIQPPRRAPQDVPLLFLGMAERLLGVALLMGLCALLFLVLNSASATALLGAVGLFVVCAILLLAARLLRAGAEDSRVRSGQRSAWAGILRAGMRGRDLSGFRGGTDRAVAASLRSGLTVALPRRAQVFGTLGTLSVMPGLLWFLHPAAALAYAGAALVLVIVIQMDAVYVCRRSVRGTSGRYTRLMQGQPVLHAQGLTELAGETGKWSIIGLAGFGVLSGSLPPVALMFWILASVQFVPGDFRALALITPVFDPADVVPGLVASDVPLRLQRLVGDAPLTVSDDDTGMRIEGLQPLTAMLQQPDLTAREQRLILADIVRVALDAAPAHPHTRPPSIRIFAPGQDVTEADFDQIVLYKETATGAGLPGPANDGEARDAARGDPVLRALLSCDPGDLPVFWDVRGRMPADALQTRVSQSGLARAGHLTMGRLTLVEAA